MKPSNNLQFKYFWDFSKCLTAIFSQLISANNFQEQNLSAKRVRGEREREGGGGSRRMLRISKLQVEIFLLAKHFRKILYHQTIINTTEKKEPSISIANLAYFKFMVT